MKYIGALRVYAKAATKILVGLSVLMLPANFSIAADNQREVLSEILQDWSLRRQIASSMVYEIVGHVVVPRGSYPDGPEPSSDQIPKQDHEYDLSIELIFDFRNSRSRRTTDREVMNGPEGRFVPQFMIDMFDGQEFFNFKPRDRNTSDRWTPAKYDAELHFRGPKSMALFFHAIDFPVFFGHGSIPSENLQITPDHMLREPDASIFSVQPSVQYQGRQCVVLETVPLFMNGRGHYELWVDTDRKGTIVRWTNYVEDRLVAVVEIENEPTNHGWLPSRWTRTLFEQPNLPIVESVFVKSRVFDPELSDSAFQIELKPGMITYDYKTRSNSVILPNGEMMPLGEWQLKNSAFSKSDEEPSRSSSATLTIIVVNVIIIGLIVVFWLRRSGEKS